jgi:tetratricopeptide (TPR) repeat protein
VKKNQKPAGWLIAEKAPLLAISAFLGVMTILAQRSGGAISTLENIPLDYRIANTFLSYIKYICKILWPIGLGVYYPYPHVNFSDMAVMVCMVTFILLTVFVIYTGRRRKYIAVGWLWFVGTLVPMTGLVQVGLQGMADRYMYLSILGLLIIVAWLVKGVLVKHSRLKLFAAILAGAVLSSLIILTRIQTGYWKNDLTLFEHALKVTKNNAAAEQNYGATLFKVGRLDEAKAHLSEAIRLIPTFTEARDNLGKILLVQGKAKEAEECFNYLLRHNADTAEIHYNLGAALFLQTKYEAAIRHFAEALKRNPDYPDAREKMGMTLLATGRLNEAIACFNDALRKNRDSAEVHYNLAIALGTQKKYDEAIEHLAKVLQLNPAYPEAHNKIGFALRLAGRSDEAIKYLNEGLKININKNQETYANLGSAYIQVGKYDLAIENLTKAIELKPDNIDVLNKLAWLFAVVDNTTIHNAQKAVEFAQRGCELTGYKDPMLLDTLAAAYAAGDRFDEAVTTAQQAIDAAKASGQDALVGKIQNRIKLYQAGQPYREK